MFVACEERYWSFSRDIEKMKRCFIPSGLTLSLRYLRDLLPGWGQAHNSVAFHVALGLDLLAE